jgi:hypothetical protein
MDKINKINNNTIKVINMKITKFIKVQRLVLEQNPITGSSYYIKDFFEEPLENENLNLEGGEIFMNNRDVNITITRDKTQE